MWLSDTQKIGVGLTSGGVGFIFLGCILFFDRGLLALGNLLFLTGLVLIIGPSKSVSFFVRPQKWRGTLAFFAGLIMVLSRYTFLGILVEFFGFLNLFGDFFPVLVAFLRKIPVIGDFLNAPGVAQFVDKIAGGQPSPVLKSQKADPNAKCQKCLEKGHWTADCTNERTYKSRPSRTALLKNPSLRRPEETIKQKELEELEAERETAAAEILAQSKALHLEEAKEEESSVPINIDKFDEAGEDSLSDTTVEDEDSFASLSDTTDDEENDSRSHKRQRPSSEPESSSGYSDSD